MVCIARPPCQEMHTHKPQEPLTSSLGFQRVDVLQSGPCNGGELATRMAKRKRSRQIRTSDRKTGARPRATIHFRPHDVALVAFPCGSRKINSKMKFLGSKKNSIRPLARPPLPLASRLGFCRWTPLGAATSDLPNRRTVSTLGSHAVLNVSLSRALAVYVRCALLVSGLANYTELQIRRALKPKRDLQVPGQ